MRSIILSMGALRVLHPLPRSGYVSPAERKTDGTYKPKPAKIRVHVEHAAKSTVGGVIDFFYAPLAGASVTLDTLSGTTDENGTVTFEVPAGSYTVSVSAPDFLPDSQSISAGLGQEVDVYFVLNRDIPKQEGSWWDPQNIGNN